MGTILSDLDSICLPVSKFWGDAVVPGTFDFTPCFENTVLLIFPCVFLLICAAIRFASETVSVVPLGPLSFLHVCRSVFILLVGLVCLTEIAEVVYEGIHNGQENIAKYQYISPSILFLTTVVAFCLLQRDRNQGIRSSGSLFMFWLLMTFYSTFALRTSILIELYRKDLSHTQSLFQLVMAAVSLLLFTTLLILSAIPDRKSMYTPVDADHDPSPEATAPFLSQISFWWMNSLIVGGYKKPLVTDDLFGLLPELKTSVVIPKFFCQWNKEVTRAREKNRMEAHRLEETIENTSAIVNINESTSTSDNDNEISSQTVGRQQYKKHVPSLFAALARSFGLAVFVAGVFKLFQDLLIFVSPQLLKLMIGFTEDPTIPDRQGYIYAALLFLASELQSILLHQYFHRCNKTGLNLRTSLIGAIYRKALCLSGAARKSSTVGEIVNLMSVDAQRFMDVMLYLHMVWSAPLQIILASFFLWQTMGPSVLAGVGVMILLFPFNAVVATMLSKMQEKQMALKDERIKVINEVLSGIKVIKLYAWERSFLSSITELRRCELIQLRRIAYLNAALTFAFSSAPFLVSVTTFATYATTGHSLTPAKAFVGISLFNVLSFPLSMLPMLVSFLVEVSVSMRRISSFLQSDELDSDAVTRIRCNHLGTDELETPVMIRDGNFAWDSSDRMTLQRIDLTIQRHSLVAVVGQVGAGKSSLLSALLGEMHKVSGQVTIQGSVAYVNQQAWIRNATLKDNILFNKAFNVRRYRQVVEACALKPDLEMLPGGDMTEIGEKGINLSGGQKQRVSIARAVYNDADIYLLDDPLSAVDAHVGEHLFNKVIGPDGLLRNRVRIVVTHSLAYLPQCHQIVVMTDGCISEMGTYSELMERQGAFSEFLKIHGNEELDQSQQDDANDKSKEKLVERQDSVTSVYRRQLSSISDDKQEQKAGTTLIDEEVAETGRVKLGILLDYAKAAGIIIAILLLLSFAGVDAFAIASNIWLSKWSDANKDKNTNHPVSYYLGIYTALGILQSACTMTGSVFLAIGAVRASRLLHKHMLKTVLRAPMSFFDMTPLGRIVNRFSKDMYMIDEMIPESIFWCLFCFFIILSIIVVISYTTPIFLPVVVPIGIVYFFTQRYYVATSRQVMRLESVSRSPIFSHFQETLAGTSTVRAYCQQDLFIEENDKRVDFNQLAYYPYLAGNRWLAIRLEFSGNFVVLFAALFAVIERNHLSGGLVGLSLSYALQCTENLTWFVRMTSELESRVVSVERINEYGNMATEAPAVINSSRPPSGWPRHGQVCFNRYSVRYRPELDLVLRNVDCTIAAGEKVGIVGRTGAGKSSLTLGLFRILEAAEGSITIDNVDLASIGLEDLRSHVTIIPQDPVLFSGTVRVNLDPFNQYVDSEVWHALEQASLRSFVESLESGLNSEVAEGGENLSVGQRQLMCLARALLRKSKVLVLDEATAAVDLETDSVVQQTIHTSFADCTVLTIAHRLNTIMESDRVMVLDKGSIVEFDSPGSLLAQRGIFHSMAVAVGLAN